MDKGKKQDFTGAELLEVKKSRKADLEQNRSTWLLLVIMMQFVNGIKKTDGYALRIKKWDFIL